MPVTDTKTPEERLEELPAHEAFAVFGKLYEELLLESQRLARRIDAFEGMDTALARALGNGLAAQAGNDLFLADDPENRAYLAELVERVRGDDGEDRS